MRGGFLIPDTRIIARSLALKHSLPLHYGLLGIVRLLFESRLLLVIGCVTFLIVELRLLVVALDCQQVVGPPDVHVAAPTLLVRIIP